MQGELGRKVPTDWKHVEKYPLRIAIAPEIPVGSHERSLGTVSYLKRWDQGNEGACVGFGTSLMLALTNRKQRGGLLHKYDPWWLYREAQKVDEWPGESYSGTSVRAACDVLREFGHIRILVGRPRPVSLSEGIEANRWATNVDDIRAAIYNNLGVSIGVNWYSNFDRPVLKGNDGHWIGEGDLGRVRGGHCVCIYRFSDRRQAFRIMNSWGAGYPLVWLPYETMQRLLDEDGEATVITDR